MELTRYKFKNYSKNDWGNLISKSLKSISLNDIRWEVFPGLEGMPFAAREDLVSIPDSGFNFGQHDWNIGVMISDPDMLCLLDEEGIEAVFVDLNPQNWQTLKNRYLSRQIKWHLPIQIVLRESEMDDNKSEFSEFLQNAHGSLILESFDQFSFPELQRLLLQNAKGFGLVYHLQNQSDNKLKVDGFVHFIKTLTAWIEREQLNEKDIIWLFDHLSLMVGINHLFLFETAFLRSMQIVWYNILKLYQLPSWKLRITAVVDNNFINTTPNDQLILNTTSVAAAIISGADTIFVNNDNFEDNKIENQILAKNMQLICRHEVRLDMVSDALAGSYALEELTAKLTNNIWHQL